MSAKENSVNRVDEMIKAKQKPQSRVASVMGARDIDTKEDIIIDNLVSSIEKRTYRTSIVIKPSTHKKALEKAKNLNISFNEAINQLLETWIK